MLAYDFMVNALVGAGLVAVVAGTVGFFLVLRGQTFAGHALSHVGFAGAAGAGLVGAVPLAGLIAFTLGAAALIGLAGERVAGRDVAIGIVLAFALGLGLFFLWLTPGSSTRATAILFGNVLAVSRPMLATLAVLAAVTLAGLAAIARPLLFATLQPELAEAKGVRLRLVSTLFLLVTALAVAVAAEIVGVLLVFALMVAPAAAAQRLSRRTGAAVALSAAIALAGAWGGITLGWYSGWPVSFCIVLLATLAWLGAGAAGALTRPAKLG